MGDANGETVPLLEDLHLEIALFISSNLLLRSLVEETTL
jgi:hypothetical protein